MQILVSCTKGILNDSLETPQQILSRVLPAATTRNLAYLSGPSFAAEVAAGQPTVVTIASANDQAAGRAQMLLSNSRFRCYRTNDVEGRSLAVHAIWPQHPQAPHFPMLQYCLHYTGFCSATCHASLSVVACRCVHSAQNFAHIAQHTNCPSYP